MGKWRWILPMTLAVVISLIVAVSAVKLIQAQRPANDNEKVEPQTVTVAVAAEDLPLGRKIQPKMIRVTRFLRESLPPGCFSDPEAVKGRVVIAPIMKDEPITDGRLAPEDVTVGGVAAIVNMGKRAVAVKGDKVIGISGFIQPGNRVDVLVTVSDPRTKREVTKIVLENVPVLATGTLIQENDEGKPAPVDVYTLEVTPEEGEKLALAAAKGRLQFALRNATDVASVATKGVTIPKLLSPFGAEPRAKAKRRSSGGHAYLMEVIKGGEVVTKKFK